MDDDSTTGAQGAQDLDSILNEYESKTRQEPPKSDGLESKVDQIYQVFQQQEQEKTEADINAAVTSVKGDIDIDPDLVRGYLEVTASKDKDFQKAFENRKSNPTQWNKALEKVQGTFNEMFSKIDRKATEDTQDLVSAVTGSNQSKPRPEEAPDYSKMSNAEFNAEMRKLGI